MNASQYWTTTSSLQPVASFQHFANGGTIAPQPGDILCFSDGANNPGHIAIVREVFQNKISVIQQNVTESYRDANFWYGFQVQNGTFTVDASNLNAGGLVYSCQGWLRLAKPIPVPEVVAAMVSPSQPSLSMLDTGMFVDLSGSATQISKQLLTSDKGVLT